MQASDYIAIGSAVVSVCALGATMWQGWIAYQHNRLSTRPHLVWHISRTAEADGTCGIKFSVRNLGLGPAIIKGRYLTKDDVKFEHLGLATDEVPAFLVHAYGQKIKYHLPQFGLPGVDSAIASGQEFIIAEVVFPSLPLTHLQAAVELAGDIGFHMLYESLYKQKFEMHQK